jgi:homoserine O-succinyltransferase
MTAASSAAKELHNVLRAGQPASRQPRLSIGIVNNMPDAAFQATERHFGAHLRNGANGLDIRIHLFAIPEIERSLDICARINSRYTDYSRLNGLHMDALVVTGAAPKTELLNDELYWGHLTRLADWARTRTLSVLWSCLSAHAVVQHLDGIMRHRLPKKLSGLYRVERRNVDPLLADVDPLLWVPHSRYNGLSEEALRAAGYTIMTSSQLAGVDMFSKRTPSHFVFLQGHPEYDSDTLMREYRRDVLRYLKQERDAYPDIPENYFDAKTEAALEAFRHRACNARRAGGAKSSFPDLGQNIPQVGRWHTSASKVFRNWIQHVAALKMRQPSRQGAAV